ncbi:hypothetical protein [Tautonia plasticadhaerens]|uniref:Uncharacterized protein n=1 Tax=Tautonia plasticadhaerens TaxID=2527974 RepID=A0A518H4G0_9BACT|nr:hypothetical protein [Tautonia plasticadhaerens]QDV35707.1 hypothetical protein ElP_36120 [Tautonia plasticadhaerens]
MVGSDRAVIEAIGPGLDRLKARTRRYLDLLWPQIEIVAGALVEERHLCGDEVAHLLRDFRTPRRLTCPGPFFIPGLSAAMAIPEPR